MAEEFLNNKGLVNLAPSKDTDFIGFTFGERHSSAFGIVRVSDGSRYNDDLLPTIKDNTIQIPGGDGTYYFGSNYTQKQFNISYAFDNLSESQLRELKNWLGDKKLRDLIFDEAPYKIYKAKVTGSSTFKHLCFIQDGQRIYKGEGNIQFTCYSPFARSRFKYLKDYDETFLNKKEWAASSGMLDEQGNYDKIYASNKIQLYNPGDLETDFLLEIGFQNNEIAEGSFVLYNNSSRKIVTETMVKQNDRDVAIRFNSKNNLIEGIDEDGRITGSLYNQFIKEGDFFKIPLGEDIMTITGYPLTTQDLKPIDNIKIRYDYLYF